MNEGMFTSATDEWPTPQEFYNALHAEFDFILDPCATPENAKCPAYFTRGDDGLSRPWFGRVYMNPPYGREIGAWMEKAWNESRRGVLVVCLVPARTDTKWWHDFAMKAREIRLVRGRLRFGEATAGAPFPSAVVIFDPACSGPPVLAAAERRAA